MKTELSTGDVSNLAKILNDSVKKGLKTDTVPGKPAFIADINYWLPDVVGLREHIAQLHKLTWMKNTWQRSPGRFSEYDASIPKE